MNELAFVTENPIAVLTDETKFSEFYQRIKAEVAAHVPDLSTKKGRDEIASLAYKVTRTKTTIDAAGKKLNEQARSQINVVDASRRRIREELDALANEIRAPLDTWESIEEARKLTIYAFREDLLRLSRVEHGDGSNVIADRIGSVERLVIDPDVFQDETGPAKADRAKVIADLQLILARAKQHETDQAELARLRQEQEARDKADRDRVEAERRELERKQAEQLAKDRAERAEQDRKEREERIVEEARQAAERKAQDAIKKAEAEKQAILDGIALKERLDREAGERIEREQARRDADRKHRGRVMGEARTAIMRCGADGETAKKVVLAIVAGEIPNVTLRF